MSENNQIHQETALSTQSVSQKGASPEEGTVVEAASFVDKRKNPFESLGKNPFASDAARNHGARLPTGEELSVRAWPAEEVQRDEHGRALRLSASELTLEIVVTWGASVLSVTHLTPPRDFVIGSGEREGAPGASYVDVLVPSAALGRNELPLIRLVDGEVLCTFPDITRGTFKEGKTEGDLSHFLQGAAPCDTLTRARQKALAVGTRLHLEVHEIGVHISLGRKTEVAARGFLEGIDWAGPQYFGMTAGFFGTLMLTLAYFAPNMNLTDEASLNKQRQLLISQYLDAASEREQEAEKIPVQESGAEASGETGTRATGDEGEAGKEDAPRVSARASVAGPRDTKTLQIPRHEALALAREFGMIELLGANPAVTTQAWTNPLGGESLLGNQDVTAQGNMWGDAIGESGGSNGLGLSGVGFGGGDTGDNLGIGLKFGSPIGPGTGLVGIGRSNSLQTGGHKTRSPGVLRTGDTSVSGRLPPQVIQRTVRQNFGRFRMCYEEGLRQNPTLEGRVVVRFLIDSEGSVKSSSTLGGFPDAKVQSCVASAFYGISFPSPEGGVVTVTYPLMFSPE